MCYFQSPLSEIFFHALQLFTSNSFCVRFLKTPDVIDNIKIFWIRSKSHFMEIYSTHLLWTENYNKNIIVIFKNKTFLKKLRSSNCIALSYRIEFQLTLIVKLVFIIHDVNNQNIFNHSSGYDGYLYRTHSSSKPRKLLKVL